MLLAAVALAVLTACSRASTGAGAQPAPTPALPITTGDYPMYGSAADLSWIAGRIIRSFPAGQCTYVEYSTRRGAAWGERVAIYGDAQTIARFPDGDMVVVTSDLDARPLGTCGRTGVVVRTIEEH